MYFKLGELNSNIITCYIKELLHSFNLPKVKVYTDDLKFKNDIRNIDADGNISMSQSENSLYDGKVYIKDNQIVKYEDGEFKRLSNYIYNYPIVNFTKNLIINSSEYDLYTHKYLGDYLRFLRDYHKVDLMGMYNCFWGKEATRLVLRDEEGHDYININNYKLKIDTYDSLYNYYAIPIKFDQVYTIALDANVTYDIVSVLYSDIFVETTPQELIQESFKHVSGSRFKQPFLYSTNWNCTREKEIWKHENDLTMIIKLPKIINTSIVILEGNFANIDTSADGSLVSEFIYNPDEGEINCDSKLSLLRLNDGNNYPFSDRLIEYLLKNAITSNDFISENIEYVQKMVFAGGGGIKGFFGSWDPNLTYSIYSIMNKKDILKGSSKYTNSILTLGDKNIISNANITYKLDAKSLYSLNEKEEKINLDLTPESEFALVEGDSFLVQWEEEGVIKNKSFQPDGDKTYVIKNYLNENLLNNNSYNTLSMKGNEYIIVTEVTMTSRERRFIDDYFDLTGYVDKDVESLLKLNSNYNKDITD